MFKKILAFLFILFCLCGLYAGWRAYHIRQNTAEHAAQSFTRNLDEGETAAAYKQLSPELTHGREAYWQDFLRQFKGQGAPQLTDKIALKNTFNTYPEHSEPQRFTYNLKLNGKNYQLVLILLKVNKNWQVSELSGDNTP